MSLYPDWLMQLSTGDGGNVARPAQISWGSIANIPSAIVGVTALAQGNVLPRRLVVVSAWARTEVLPSQLIGVRHA
jgi:Ca2+/Na+ antiporter